MEKLFVVVLVFRLLFNGFSVKLLFLYVKEGVRFVDVLIDLNRIIGMFFIFLWKLFLFFFVFLGRFFLFLLGMRFYCLVNYFLCGEYNYFKLVFCRKEFYIFFSFV